MNSPLIKPFSAKTRQSITSPNNLQRKSSIISGIIAKAEKKPKLKKRINLGKEEDANGHTALTAGLRSTEPIIPSNFRKNSLVFINSSGLNKKPKEETKSNFHKASEKENKVFIDDPFQSLMDISRLIKKKLFKKAFYITEKFLNSSRLFRLFYELRYNRMQLILVNKLCKLKFFKNQTNHTNFVQKLLIHGLMSFRNYCNFLTIFFNKKYPHFPKKIVAEEQECEPYLSFNEDIFVMPSKMKKTLTKHSSRLLMVDVGPSSSRKLTATNTSFSYETIHEKFENKNLFEGDYREDDEYFDKVMEREKYSLNQISDLAETFFFVKNLFDILLNFAILYRNTGNYQLCYSYLYFIEENSKFFEDSINPDLLNSLVKCKFLLGLFYSQFGKQEESLEVLNQTVYLCQKELVLRINMSIYTKEKDVKRKSRMNFLSCVRTLVTILFAIAKCFAYQGKFRKMYEALILAQMFAEKYLQRIDLLRKFIFKICCNLLDNLDNYFKELAEMERIIKEFLVEDDKFQQKLYESEHPPEEPMIPNENIKTLNDINEKLYKHFQCKKLNKTKCIMIPQKSQLIKDVPSPTFSRKDSSIGKRNKTHRKSTTITEEFLNTRATTEHNEPLVSYQDIINGDSFLKDDEESLDIFNKDSNFVFVENPIIAVNSKSYKEIMDKTSSKGLLNDVPSDYKPKILTTTKYFKKNNEIDQQSLETIKNANSIRRKTEETKTARDLDFYMGHIVDHNMSSKYSGKPLDKIDNDFLKHLKNEDFDKKEFSYCKKMLLMKKQENCAIKLPSHQKKPNPLNKITTNNIVEKEAGVFEGKMTQEKMNNDLRQKVMNYQKILSQQIQLDEKETLCEAMPFKMPKFVEMAFKYKEQLALTKVEKAYMEKMKEKEKIEKKALEESLKKQNKMSKKQDFYNFKSKHTLKHLLDNKKVSQSSYFLTKSHCMGKNKTAWISSYKTTCSNSSNNFLNFRSQATMNSRKSEKFSSPQNKTPRSEITIEDEEKKILKNFELAQNMIKFISEDYSKTREEIDKLKKQRSFRTVKKEKIENLPHSDRAACDLAKSSFYMSLDKHVQKKIMTFSELVRIKAKQHFKASSNFFGSSVFGTSFN